MSGDPRDARAVRPAPVLLLLRADVDLDGDDEEEDDDQRTMDERAMDERAMDADEEAALQVEVARLVRRGGRGTDADLRDAAFHALYATPDHLALRANGGFRPERCSCGALVDGCRHFTA